MKGPITITAWLRASVIDYWVAKWLSAILRQYDEQIPDSKLQIPNPKSKGPKQPSERSRL
jgi:hypothetical protein